ncbi:alpha/beta-hydrolase [Obba rivulosa]|uniref:Alpha/beta-hydrolase n=1 Tax=Obba rivulosa TaxID=1052685 RepID=A0A8E2AS85_9APHY|nr:alpha/beta-hydrolase [Obba rivulosa]
MEVVAAQTETAIPLVLESTRQAFLPLLQAKKSEIESVERKTFKYGPTDRHQLDIYYPPAGIEPAGGKAPILFFVYGGGFVNGDRVFAAPYDLVYRNVGAFFAKQGIITVIPDYRLVPEVKFPQPVEDVRDAIAWVIQNPDAASSPSVKADITTIFVHGHSAGSNHTATMVFYPGLLPADILSRIRGLILSGGAYQYSASLHSAVVDQYYGTGPDAQEKTPRALLDRVSDELIARFPDVFMLVSEKEPGDLAQGNETFHGILSKKLGKDIKFSVMKGHNHVSPHSSLMTGQGDEWGFEVVVWIQSLVALN